MKQLALIFDIDKYDRAKLNQLTDQELYDLWENQEKWDGSIKAYTLDELSESWNDDELDMSGTWMYIVKINNNQN